MPPAKNSSNMLSNEDESEPVVLTNGAASFKSGINGVANLDIRALAQSRLPLMVLISPLCAKYRKGCASGQRGNVLVEKRWWNTQILDSRRSSARSL